MVDFLVWKFDMHKYCEFEKSYNIMFENYEPFILLCHGNYLGELLSKEQYIINNNQMRVDHYIDAIPIWKMI